MKRSLRPLAFSIALSFAALASGCVAATAAGVGALAAAGTYAYEQGELRTTIDAPLDDAERATRAALEELALPIKDEASDAFNAHVTAKQVAGGDVKIDLARESDNTTRVSVRVGTFGDERQSRLILQRIRDAL
ncbi:Hypothetical protein A7982_11251 [Minicystis rosea]|nr:Hypothetical protein A7982_11251 [Minicystis rosea]